MIGPAIGEILGVAVGVAISPVPIIAVILMLFTPSARTNSLAFLVGWIIGLVVVGTIVLAIGFDSDDGGTSDAGGILKLVLGVALLAVAARRWRGRPRGGEEPTMPKWMAAIDGFGPLQAFGVAFLLSAINPKNLALTIAATVSISAAGLDTSEEIVVLAVFVAIASVTILIPVVVYLVAGSRADAVLTDMRDWLTANNDTVMAVLLLVFGVKLVGDAIVALF